MRAELFRAAHVRAAIESHVDAMAAASEEQKQNCVAAGETLQSELRAAAQAGASADSDIEAAWSNYRASIEQQLAASFDSEAQAATMKAAIDTLVAEVDASTDSFEQALAGLSATAEASVVAQAAVDAVTDAHAQVITESSVDTLTSAGIAQADAEMIVRAVFHLQLAAGSS